MFSCKYCEIFKNSYFEKHLRTTASVNSRSAVFQESLALPFKWNALTSGISWQHTHSNLVGIFSQFWQLRHSWELYTGFLVPEAVAQICSVKKVFLEISQNSQENTCARVSFLIKLQDSGLRTPFFTEHLQCLLLWFILVTTTWASWFSGQVQTGRQGFYLPYSPEKLSKFRRENTCFVFSKKSSEVLFFLISFLAGIYLFKAWSCSKVA